MQEIVNVEALALLEARVRELEEENRELKQQIEALQTRRARPKAASAV